MHVFGFKLSKEILKAFVAFLRSNASINVTLKYDLVYRTEPTKRALVWFEIQMVSLAFLLFSFFLGIEPRCSHWRHQEVSSKSNHRYYQFICSKHGALLPSSLRI